MTLKKFLKKALKFLLPVLAVLAVTRFCHEKTGKFELYKICSDLPFSKDWDTGCPSKEELANLKTVFNQPFRFIGKGGQAFVFGSDDGKYVIKFFRISRLQAPIWLKALNPPFLESYRQRVTLEKKALLKRDFTSYATAWKELHEETGLVFCHLNKTDFLSQKLKIYDKIGISYEIDLDRMEFVVQKKADLFFPYLELCLTEQNQEKIRQALSSFVRLLHNRYQKAIKDNDPNLKINFGFVEGHPIQIDIGRFEKSPAPISSMEAQKEIVRIVAPLRDWLETRDPRLANYLDEQI